MYISSIEQRDEYDFRGYLLHLEAIDKGKSDFCGETYVMKYYYFIVVVWRRCYDANGDKA